jgi:glycolate oxidase
MDLKKRIGGRVLEDAGDLKRYSRDQGIYRIQPRCVVIPSSIEDIVTAVRIAVEAGVPITPRGGGSGTAGAGLGPGLMIAIDRNGPLNKISNFDPSKSPPEITVDAGLIHSKMQDFLKEKGFYLPADPSSGDISLLGGNIATKASGPHALKHGSIDRYLKHLRFVTARGNWVDTADESTIPGPIIEGILTLRREIRADKETVFQLHRRADRKIASGYNLFAFLKDMPVGELVAQAMVGSVGTLGIITGATLLTEPIVEGKATMVLSFKDLHEAGDAVQYIRTLGVAAIEIISAGTVRIVKARRKHAFETLKASGHLLLVEFEGEQRLRQVNDVKQAIIRHGYRMEAPPYIADDDVSQAILWKDRKLLLPAILNYDPSLKALSVINDVGIDVPRLADFIREVEDIFEQYNLVAAVYGHAGSGNLHLRPLFNVSRPDLRWLIREVADRVYNSVLKHDGTITAEHGMGRLRAPYLETEWGPMITGYMKRLKHLFDPTGILNPEVMFSDRSIVSDLDI